MDLGKKMKNYGREVLSKKDSAKKDRKKRKMVQRLRRTSRAKQAALSSRINELIAQEDEKDRIMEEYLGAEDVEVTSD